MPAFWDPVLQPTPRTRLSSWHLARSQRVVGHRMPRGRATAGLQHPLPSAAETQVGALPGSSGLAIGPRESGGGERGWYITRRALQSKRARKRRQTNNVLTASACSSASLISTNLPLRSTSTLSPLLAVPLLPASALVSPSGAVVLVTTAPLAPLSLCGRLASEGPSSEVPCSLSAAGASAGSAGAWVTTASDTGSSMVSPDISWATDSTS